MQKRLDSSKIAATSVPTGGGFLKIATPCAEISISAPVAANVALDTVEGFFADALTACSANVPRLDGFGAEFRAEIHALYQPTATRSAVADAPQMLKIYDFTVARLLFDKFDGANPGHVFVALQCFGGLWAGVSSQTFAAVLVRRCNAVAHAKPGLNALDLAVAVLASIAKCFGSSMRTAAIVPRWPDGAGTPPDPVVLLADALLARFPAELPFADRSDLVLALRTWHVPRAARDAMPDWKLVWSPHRLYDRTRAMMQLQLSSMQDQLPT